MKEEVTSKEELRKFGLTMALILVLFSAVGIYKYGEVVLLSTVLIVLASIFGVLGLVAPMSLSKVESLWMKFAELIHSVMTPLILTVTYYVLMTPIGLIVRLMGKDILQLKLDKEADTYWDKVDQEGSASRYYTPY